MSHTPKALVFPSMSYSFLSLLPCTESLAIRGRRLNDTPVQRQGIVYAPDILLGTDVRESGVRLRAEFTSSNEESTDGIVTPVFDGELRRDKLSVTNYGSRSISDIWLILPSDGSVWIDDDDKGVDSEGPCFLQLSRSQLTYSIFVL